jgi:hypothetical protein
MQYAEFHSPLHYCHNLLPVRVTTDDVFAQDLGHPSSSSAGIDGPFMP